VGTVKGIYIAAEAGGRLHGVRTVRAVAGHGLEGDRYAAGVGFYSATPTTDGARELTLIEQESIDAVRKEGGIELADGETRRNVVTGGIRLKNLLGKRFTIGAVVCEGVRDCPPCNHLDELTGKSLMRLLVRTGGLRARIVEGGTIAVEDRIEIVGEAAGPSQAKVTS